MFNQNDVALTEFYRAWIVRITGNEESDRMSRALQELNESARSGDPIPSASELMTATDADALIALIAKANNEDPEDLKRTLGI